MHKIAVLLICLALFSCGKKEVKPSEFDPEAEFAKANKLIEDKDYEGARKLLTEISGRDTTGKYAPVAQLRLADSYLKEGEPELAAEEFRRFLETYAWHKYAPYAQYQLAMVYYEQVGEPDRGYGSALKALEEFEVLNSVYPRNPYREFAEAAIEKCLDILADYEFMVGEFYLKKEAYKGALGRFLGVLEKFPGYKKEADVLYGIALSYRGLGDADMARQYYDLLISKYPRSKVAEKAKKEF
jgi:outer membrane protein assembly factor BamD